MQLQALIVAILLSATLLGPGSEGAEVHDFHYSRFGLQWNAETSTWQGILRVFTDDLEMALNGATSAPIMWKLGDDQEHPESDAAIEAYAKANWQLTDSTGLALDWAFIGKEVDYDITFIYLESDSVALDLACFANSRGFHELFDDQVNEFTLNTNGAELRLWLTSEDPTRPLATIPHE